MEINIKYNYGPIIERLDKLVYSNNYGISKEEFKGLKESLTSAINKLNVNEQKSFNEDIEQFKKAETPEKKESIAKRIGKIFENYSVGIASKITADIITKVFMGI